MRPRLLLLLLLAGGLVLGLGYAWLIEPVTYTESSPAQVVASYRHTWLIMAAEAYAQDGDWTRTQLRLDALHDPNLPQTASELFDHYSAQGPNPIARALARLADRLGQRTAAMNVYLATPVITPTPAPTSTHTSRPTLTATPRPTVTATPRPIVTKSLPTTMLPSAYQLISRVAECTQPPTTPQIRVIIQDAAGRGTQAQEVWITWDGGADRFVTGLKPEIDPGYGDFDMALDQSYNISIDKPTAVIVTGLQAEPCLGDGHLSWRVVLKSTTR
jgi:hypothetical protein